MIDDLITREGAITGLFRGEVSQVPATTSDGAFVIVPEFSDEHEFGPCPWPTDDAWLPSDGDQCLVHIDASGDGWIVAWDNT